MRYDKVFIEAIGYELPPEVVTSDELEERLHPAYQALRIPAGQLESLTGIVERRWWESGYPLSEGAVAAARHALQGSAVGPKELDVLIYAGVCRELFEPATACRVASRIGVHSGAAVYDLSNACLGVLNGMVDIANRIELGQIRAGMVVSCESSREIVEIAIAKLLKERTMANYKESLATLTGGSGAVAVLLTDGSFSGPRRRRLVGGVTQTAPQFHSLCRWGIERLGNLAPSQFHQFMATDSIAVLKHGVELGFRTWKAFTRKLSWREEQVDKVICHQVGISHRQTVLKELGIDQGKEFSTFAHLGNIGTVSLPLTAAVAEERDFLRAGDRVGLLGIGSGLNCLMLGVEW